MKLSGAEGRKLALIPDKSKGIKFDATRPPEGAIGTIAWANQMAARLFHKVLENADGDLTFKEQLRYGSDLVGKIGMTHSKALFEERLLKQEKALGIAKGQHEDDGLEDDSESK